MESYLKVEQLNKTKGKEWSFVTNKFLIYVFDNVFRIEMPRVVGQLLRHVTKEDAAEQEVDVRRSRSQTQRRSTRSEIRSGKTSCVSVFLFNLI